MIGQTIAHYRIVKKIARGGMGDVFLAEDTKLDRRVALKALPAEFADDPDRRERLAREAKTIAALNHPNIVTVYSVERVDDIDFITMELVEGRTLAELLPRTGFPLDEFFAITIPLVDAVAAAHQYGVLHRDLKPGNVMVRDDTGVKVLDFGLAKAPRRAVDVDAATTITPSHTSEGHVVGTPAYMSPEQAEGKVVDARSDIFSLGVLFYELLTGRRPFTGDTRASVVSSILKDLPRPISEVKASIPREVSRLVHRCLAKPPIDRYQTAIDLRHDLKQAQQDSASGEPGPTASVAMSTRLRAAGWLLLGAAITAAGTGTWLLFSRMQPEAPAVPRLQNAIQVTSALDVESYPTWAPGGDRLAYQSSGEGWTIIGDYDIWVTQIGSGEPVNLTRGSAANDRMPSWSPNGREIAFFSDRDGEWAVFTVPALGGNPRKVLALPGIQPYGWSAPQWSSDGTKLFVAVRQQDANVVVVLTLATLERTQIAIPDHGGEMCWDLNVRPDGGRFAYLSAGRFVPEVARLWTVRSSGDEAVPLTDGLTMVWSPTWAADGRSVFYVSNRGGSMELWQQPVSDDGRAAGEPLLITPGLDVRTAAFSPDGTKVAFTRGGLIANVIRVPILEGRAATWVDAQQLTFEHAFIEFVDVSPNGQLLALSSNRRGNQDLWVLPLRGGALTQLTIDPTPDWNPRWSPDGQQIAFYSLRSGNRDIWVMPSRGGPARQLFSSPYREWSPSWAPDGGEIAFSRITSTDFESLIVNAGGGDASRLAAGDLPEWFPDGQSLVVRRADGLYRVSRHGGDPILLVSAAISAHRIAPDGRSVYYSVVTGPPENHGVWKVSLDSRTVNRLTNLEQRRGRLGYYFAADAKNLYLGWREDEGDIWVMDVVNPARR